MTYSRAVLTFLILLGSCLGQERGGADPKVALPFLTRVLGKGNASGSLEYWGRCDFQKPNPDFPAFRDPTNESGSSAEVLRKFFASDPWMQVTQDPSGLIRMVETDVPTDLLDVTIDHLSFNQTEGLGGPNNAIFLVLSAPEVKAYRKSHNIGPFTDGRILPGDSASKQRVSGDLYGVTVRQALDYILRFYPGLWIYENCTGNDIKTGRSVFFTFFIAYLPRNNRAADGD